MQEKSRFFHRLGTKQQRHIVTMASRNMNDWRGTISGLNIVNNNHKSGRMSSKRQLKLYLQ
jgi:hypothetical protein